MMDADGWMPMDDGRRRHTKTRASRKKLIVQRTSSRAHPHATRTDGHGEARGRFRDDETDETDAGIDRFGDFAWIGQKTEHR